VLDTPPTNSDNVTDTHYQGLPGIITLKNGDKYSGVLSGTSLDPSELRYVFKMVKKLLPASNAQTNGTGEASDDYVGVGDYYVKSFDMSDVADFNVNNVVLDKSQVKGQNGMHASCVSYFTLQLVHN
jgi:hypothetical protein